MHQLKMCAKKRCRPGLITDDCLSVCLQLTYRRCIWVKGLKSHDLIDQWETLISMSRKKDTGIQGDGEPPFQWNGWLKKKSYNFLFPQVRECHGCLWVVGGDFLGIYYFIQSPYPMVYHPVLKPTPSFMWSWSVIIWLTPSPPPPCDRVWSFGLLPPTANPIAWYVNGPLYHQDCLVGNECTCKKNRPSWIFEKMAGQ